MVHPSALPALQSAQSNLEIVKPKKRTIFFIKEHNAQELMHFDCPLG
ncbi:hypothetical protein [Bartonella kosoyi]|nr:hypothetical protein [Bartonella kosoyi]